VSHEAGETRGGYLGIENKSETTAMETFRNIDKGKLIMKIGIDSWPLQC
jgi:hypothetical protein